MEKLTESPLFLILGIIVVMAAVMGLGSGEDAPSYSLKPAQQRLEVLPQGDGPLAPEPPRQAELTTVAERATPKITLAGGFVATKRFHFDLKAVVLNTRKYRYDATAEISSLDLALGWGPMSDPAVLQHVKVKQSLRFARVKYGKALQIPVPELEESFANIHVIAATPEIEAQLAQIRPGEVVDLGGYLVDVLGEDGGTWSTSTVRYDTGSGACEIMLITRVGPDPVQNS